MNKQDKGFIPVMLTPFLDNGKIDYDGLTALTEMYLSAGASGLFANCLSSEMFELTEQERIDITAHVVKVAGGSVPVVATGSFFETATNHPAFIKKIQDTGVQAVILISNMFAAENEPDGVLRDNFFNLLEHTEKIPLGFYECPVPYKRLISAQHLGEFVGTGRLTYHKDTCCDIEQVKEKLKAAAGHQTEFGFYDAYMGHAVDTLRVGAAGLSCIQGNFWPELIAWLCSHYNDADKTHEVEMVDAFLKKTMDIIHHAYPMNAKIFLQQRGKKIGAFTRRQSGIPDKKDVERLQGMLEETKQIYAALGLAL